MMEKMKHFRLKWILRMGFCLALVAAMVLIGAVLAGAEVVSGDCGHPYHGEIQWTLDTETGILTIEGEGQMNWYSHSTLQKQLQPWYDYRDSIFEVFISEGITHIGSEAFCGCNKIQSVRLPDSLISIGDEAFESCDNLKNIQIPQNVKEIGAYAFSGCSITEMFIPMGVTVIEESCFSGCKQLQTIVICGDLETIERSAFSGCVALSGISIPQTVTKIGEYAFSNCSSITTLDVPEGVTRIESFAFSGCSKLEEIQLPSSYTIIGNSSFEGCSMLKSIEIPDTVKGFGNSAFKNCSSIDAIVIPEGITRIGMYTFYGCSSLKNIVLPDTVQKIDDNAFAFCTSLEQITIPEGVESIPWNCFNYCTNLKEINIPDSVSYIGREAFRYCTSLESIKIPYGVTNIYYWTFYNCQNLANVSIPCTVTTIENNAFELCSKLESITIPYSVTLVKSNAFAGCGKLHTVFFENADGWMCHITNYWNKPDPFEFNVKDNVEIVSFLVGTMHRYIECEKRDYTITFVADRGIVASVPYWNTNHNIEIPAVPHKPGYSGVWEDFDLTNGGDITVHAIYTPTESKLTGASVSLGQSLALNYYAVLTPAHTAAQMRFTYHGETTLVSGVLDEASGEYKFTFGRIPPQCMGDNVKAELILISEDGTETVLDVKESYSIREYCDDALAANPNNEALATLLADLLAYGDAAQDYANYNEDTPAGDGFEVAPSQWEAVTDTDLTLSDKTSDTVYFAAAGVRFDYVNRVYFKIKAADLTGVTLTVNGKTYTADDLILVENTADTYVLYTDAVYATEFDKVFTAKLALNGEELQTVTYSVRSYVYTKQNSNDTELAALVRALYNYGRSAIAYKNAQ